MPDLSWEKRLLLVFSPDEQNAGFQYQKAILQAIEGGLSEGDMTVIRAFADDRGALQEPGHAKSTAS